MDVFNSSFTDECSWMKTNKKAKLCLVSALTLFHRWWPATALKCQRSLSSSSAAYLQCCTILFQRFVHPSCSFWQSSGLAEMVRRYEKNEHSLIIAGVIKLSDLPGAQRDLTWVFNIQFQWPKEMNKYKWGRVHIKAHQWERK